MKIYDISQEVFDCEVYPGDPAPKKETLSSIDEGALYNLSAFSMCAHNGTHIDAPFHFLRTGKTIEKLALEKLVGLAAVVICEGELSADGAREILARINRECPEAAKKLLFKGNALITLEASRVFAAENLDLIAVESQTVGPEDAPMAVHKALLSEEVVLLEGVRLGEVPEGAYLLCAAPLSLAGADGSPCRAILIERD